MAAGNDGFRTKQAAMLTGVMKGVKIQPIITVGDELSNGYRFEAIPDGISVRTKVKGKIDVYVNHETSKVPFPFNSASPSAGGGQSDFKGI